MLTLSDLARVRDLLREAGVILDNGLLCLDDADAGSIPRRDSLVTSIAQAQYDAGYLFNKSLERCAPVHVLWEDAGKDGQG